MSDPDLIQRIRAIFLHHCDRVTLSEAADMLGWSRAEMNAAVRSGDVEAIGTCSGKMIELRELVGQALNLWSLTTIEEALGRDALLILPPALRTRKFTVRVPMYQIAALQILADEERESVDAMVERTFHELVDHDKQWLAARVPGLAEAIDWPEVEETQQPC